MSITPSTVAKQLRVFMDSVEDQVPNRKWSVDLDVDNGFIIQTDLDDEEFDDGVFEILDYESNPVIYRKDNNYDILLSADDELVSFIVKIHDEDVDMDDFPQRVTDLLGISDESDDESE